MDAVSSFLIAVLCIVYFSSSIFGVFDTLLIFVVVFFLWSVINTTGMPCIFIENSLLKTYTTTVQAFLLSEKLVIIKLSELNTSTYQYVHGIKSAFKTH